MTNISEILNHFSPSFRSDMIVSEKFKSRFGMQDRILVSFFYQGSTASFSKDLFLKAAVEFLDGSGSELILDNNGRGWKFNFSPKSEISELSVSLGSGAVAIPDFRILSTDVSFRLRSFDRLISTNFFNRGVNFWRLIVAERPLTIDEFDVFWEEYQCTPLEVSKTLTAEFAAGNFSVAIPNQRSYYSNLGGEICANLDLVDGLGEKVKPHIQFLFAHDPYSGFLDSLMLASQVSISKIIAECVPPDMDLPRAYKWVEDHGDVISQTGAIEVGFLLLDKHPYLEEKLVRLALKIFHDDISSEESRVSLLASFFIAVEAHLSSHRVLMDARPWWRRMVSLAHASQLERVAIPYAFLGHSSLMHSSAPEFYFQTLADLRQEPRWFPDYGAAVQLKSELLGRIILIAQSYASRLTDSGSKSVFLGENPTIAKDLENRLSLFFPGPLEGGLPSQFEMPSEILLQIQEELNKPDLDLAAFSILLNSALIYRLDSGIASLAAKAIKSAKYDLVQGDLKGNLASFLLGLATVSAVTRSVDLAIEVRNLTFKFLADSEENFSPQELTSIGLMAAAAHSELIGWCEYVGEWMTNLGFQVLSIEKVKVLYSDLLMFLHITPQLWHTCGRAEAALSAQLQ